ncbi:hypothetical protein ACWE42_11315 [Sutcliffiella cohnii]
MVNKNSNYTVLGFSKAGFGCCGHHVQCKLGTLDCAIEMRDPEAKLYCHCFQRNQYLSSKEEKNNIFEQEEDGQLSMF